MREREGIPQTHMLLILTAVAAGVIVLFMTLNAKGRWDFILPFRGMKVLSMVLVGYAITVSTVLFQTVSRNRILTPSVMGFDRLTTGDREHASILSLIAFSTSYQAASANASTWPWCFARTRITSSSTNR